MTETDPLDLTLRDDVADSFGRKGLTFVSLNESTSDPERKSTLVYIDTTGRQVTKEIDIRLEELEDTVNAIDVLDPEDLANFLLK